METRTEPPSRFTQYKIFITMQHRMGNIIDLQGCKHCHNTGLGSKYSLESCSYCKGSGVTKLKLSHESGYFICEDCNGFGYKFGKECESCHGKAMRDWLDNIIGDDMIDESDPEYGLIQI